MGLVRRTSFGVRVKGHELEKMMSQNGSKAPYEYNRMRSASFVTYDVIHGTSFVHTVSSR